MGKMVKYEPTRRQWMGAAVASGLGVAHSARADSSRGVAKRASIAITLDLEMSRHYPRWDDTHWDFEKGNLDGQTKSYAVEAARRVKSRGGIIHFFALGQTMEQEDVGWLKSIALDGHPIGNHTYDHVNVKATRAEDIQFRFQRAPWLIEGKSPGDVIAANIRLGARALEKRLGIAPAGFRTPGGFHDGLTDRPDLQAMVRKLGYAWVSSKYPGHPLGTVGARPDDSVIAAIVAAQAQAQPFVYPNGLVEVPMSPVSDVTALRSGRWPLDYFLQAIRSGVNWAIENHAVFSLLAHPSCLAVADPSFKAIDLIMDSVRVADDRAALVNLDTIARDTVALTPR
jgi:peptidoglycan/xylan/chitin deacetylase (PgdA/CDA1 family)